MICVRSSLYCSSAVLAARGSSLPSRAARWTNIWVLNAAPLAQCLRDLRDQTEQSPRDHCCLTTALCSTTNDCIAEFLLSGEALEESYQSFGFWRKQPDSTNLSYSSRTLKSSKTCGPAKTETLLYSTLLSSMRLFCVLLFFLLYSLTWNHSLPRADRSLAGWGSG